MSSALGAGAVTIGGGAAQTTLPWNVVSGAAGTASANNAYEMNSGTFTGVGLPTSFSVGDRFVFLHTAGGSTIDVPISIEVVMAQSTIPVGTTGQVDITEAGSFIEFEAVTPTKLVATKFIGNVLIVT